MGWKFCQDGWEVKEMRTKKREKRGENSLYSNNKTTLGYREINQWKDEDVVVQADRDMKNLGMWRDETIDGTKLRGCWGVVLNFEPDLRTMIVVYYYLVIFALLLLFISYFILF